MPTAHTLKSTSVHKPASRVARAKPSSPALNTTVLWTVWFGAVALMLTATFGR